MARMFSRPHTVIGTALSIVFVSILAVQKASDISPLSFTGMLEEDRFKLLEIVKHKAAENEQRIQSYMNMLVVVESHVDSTLIPDRAPLSAYQYFKNMTNREHLSSSS
ncbi:hypothetical protein AHAS_Ahas11G0175200 [Arachis hypogaea]